jgi:hypothetical protein
MAATDRITKELYDAFQKLELDRWDGIVANDVLINSPAGRDLRRIEILKSWAKEFGGGFAYQIDLVDEHLAVDDQENGRGFITFNLHWKHAKEVFGLKPTERESRWRTTRWTSSSTCGIAGGTIPAMFVPTL